jgi:hypothetical protein
MAKKRRLPYKCEYCPKRFPILKSKWGHYPHCEGRKLSLEPASKPEAEAPSSTFEHRESRRPGPDSQDMKLLLLDTHEAITQLQRDADGHTFWAEFLARTASSHVEGHATPEEWGRLAQDLGDVERDLDQMKGRLRLDRSLLFNIYHKMLAVQDAWLEYQRRDFSLGGEMTPQGEEVLRTERALFADLMLKIKRMLVAAR